MVFIHFKHQNYKPIYMQKGEGDKYPTVTIMVPNSRLFYFFLVDFEVEYLEDFPNCGLDEFENIVKNNFLWEFNFRHLRIRTKITSMKLIG